MADNTENYYQIMARLDERRAKMLRDYADECEKEKAHYDLTYPIQSQSLRDHNKYMGEKKTLLEPSKQKALIDNKVNAYARELEQEQKEDEQLKRELEQIAEQRRIDEAEKHMDPRRRAFRQRMRDMDQQNEQHKATAKPVDKPKEQEQPQEDKNIDPRRLAFRQRMKQHDERRSKENDKDMEIG